MIEICYADAVIGTIVGADVPGVRVLTFLPNTLQALARSDNPLPDLFNILEVRIGMGG